MAIAASVAPIPVAAASAPRQAVVPDADFDSRWAAWVARGRVHEQRARRRFLIWGSVIAVGVAIAFALLITLFAFAIGANAIVGRFGGLETRK